MATDYDAPRRSEADELAEDSLEELKARRNENQSGVVDVAQADAMKADWEANHRFRLKFASFLEIL